MPGLPKHDHQALPDHRTDVGGDAVFIRDGGNFDLARSRIGIDKRRLGADDLCGQKRDDRTNRLCGDRREIDCRAVSEGKRTRRHCKAQTRMPLTLALHGSEAAKVMNVE